MIGEQSRVRDNWGLISSRDGCPRDAVLAKLGAGQGDPHVSRAPSEGSLLGHCSSCVWGSSPPARETQV